MSGAIAGTRYPFEDIAVLAGTDLGVTAYRVISQEDIDAFASLTGDWHWIHVNRDAAAAGPFGDTIAHGFFSLSLIGSFWPELFDVDGASMKINYGLDRVRFLSPVRNGSRLRMRATIDDVQKIPGGYRLRVSQTIEIEDEPKPALFAVSIYDIRGPFASETRERP